jgi:hypothetical protein
VAPWSVVLSPTATLGDLKQMVALRLERRCVPIHMVRRHMHACLAPRWLTRR